MKLAISNIAWNNDHDKYYQLIIDSGFSGLEIAPSKFSANPYVDLDLAKEIKNHLLECYNLPIVSMQSLLFGTNGLALFEGDKAKNQLKAYIKKAILYAEVIDCPVLVFGNPKNRVSKDSHNDYAIAVECFRDLGEFAMVHNTCLCIEPNPKEYGTNFINNVSAANKLVNDVACDGFGMIIDTSTMLINGTNPETILDALSNTKHIHISMPFLKPLNQEIQKHNDFIEFILSILKKVQYDKYISIEMTNVKFDDVAQSLEILSRMAS